MVKEKLLWPFMMAAGFVLLAVILASLWRKNLEDRLNDPTRPPGQWLYR